MKYYKVLRKLIAAVNDISKRILDPKTMKTVKYEGICFGCPERLPILETREESIL